MASLDSVKQKIIRAAEHFKTLESEVERYYSGNPGEMVGEPNPEANSVTLRFHAKQPIPVRLPFIVGDCLQNLRSSLDYLVWELVLAMHNNPDEKNMFPICSTPEAFKNQVGRHRLDGVPADAVTEIEGLQPYRYGQQWESSVLYVLDTFSNINKHRRVLLTTLRATPPTERELIGGIEYTKIKFPLTDADANLGTIRPPGKQMEVELQLFAFIVFDERPAKGIEITACLNMMLWHINEFIVPKFERFFG